MKWLFVLLVAVNVILLVVQIKGKDEQGSVSHFKKVASSKEIKLLKDGSNELMGRCVVIGAVSDAAALSVVTDYLTSKSVQFDVIDKESLLAPSYWVYVDEGLLKKLISMNVDSYLIKTGDLKGKLSVGLFANIDLAKNMIVSLRESGIDADIFEKKNIEKAKWLSFSLDEMQDGGHIIDALKNMQTNLGEIKEFFCKSIASEK